MQTTLSIDRADGLRLPLCNSSPATLSRPRAMSTATSRYSWEWSPDGLQMTLRGLRPGDQAGTTRPPVNGRWPSTPRTIIFSWNRFSAKQWLRERRRAPTLRRRCSHSRRRTRRTVAIQAKGAGGVEVAPWFLFAFNRSGGAVMFPKETDSTFDPRQDMIGTNAFMLSNYTPSVSFSRQRDSLLRQRPRHGGPG